MSLGINHSSTSTSSTDVLTQLLNAIQQSNTSNNQATQGTGSTSESKTLTPYQQALQAPTTNLITSAMTNPSQFVAPAQNQAREQVNSDYSGVGDQLRQQFLSTGGGSSGKFGTAMAQSDLARRGQLAQVDNQAATTAAALPFTAAGLAQQMLGLNFGSTGSTATTGSTAGTTAGTTTTNQDNTSTDKKTGTSSTTGEGASVSGLFGL